MFKGRIILGDNLAVLQRLPADRFPLIYIDPPFNTGKVQIRNVQVMQQSETGDRTGFLERRYSTIEISKSGYSDTFIDYIGFLRPRLIEAYRVLAKNGTFYFHGDYREIHYCKILLDEIFGRHCFLNELIWAYDYGGKSKKKWPAKHETILMYAKDPYNYVFNTDDVDREPYMAPGLVTPEKVARGKLPTDVWWHTIVPTNSSEKTGYPNQKPLGIMRRIIRASSKPGDYVLDFFAGSGTTGMAAYELGRNFLLVDKNPEAIDVMEKRLSSQPKLDLRILR